MLKSETRTDLASWSRYTINFSKVYYQGTRYAYNIINE